MGDVYIDYFKAVLADYRRKRKDNKLSLRLTQPSPAMIREECMAILKERPSRKDELILKTFFGVDERGYDHLIGNIDIDRFRPVIKFLNGGVANPLLKNVELVAWLIDFKQRPYELGKTYEEEKTDDSGDTPINIDDNKIDQGLKESEQQPAKKKRRWMIVPAAMLPVIAAGFFLINNKKIVYKPTGPQNCMYWTGERYEPISCNEHKDGTTVIALDSTRINNFHKITKPDTITQYSVGKLWYLKTDGGYEFFTDSGTHPIQTTRRLRPLSVHIVNVLVGRDSIGR